MTNVTDNNAPKLSHYSGRYAARRTQKAILTANILLSYLDELDILARPVATNARFRWYRILPDAASCENLEQTDPQMLYICRERDAEKLLERFRTIFLLAVSPYDEAPDWCRRYPNRVVVVQGTERFFYTCSLIQDVFTSLLLWEEELDNCVMRRNSLAALLEEGFHVLGNFMSVTDAWHNLVCCTQGIEPPDDVSRATVESGACDEKIIAYFEDELLAHAPANKALVDDTHVTSEFVNMHVPICFDGSMYYLLSMVCSSGASQEGVFDLFSIFAERVISLCSVFWEDNLKVDAPWYKVLTNYLDGVEMRRSYIESQLSKTQLPNAKQLKLLCFDLSMDDRPTLRARVIDAASRLNGGQVYPLGYKGMLVALCYLTNTSDSQFSSGNTYRDVNDSIYEPFGVRVGSSRIFDNIEDLDLAYRQARLALNFADITDAAHEFAGQPLEQACYSFDFCLPYYLLVESCMRNEFVEFSIRRNVLEKLLVDDEDQGSSVVRLLWTYLCSDLNASAVSKQLNMHRNTVLYHVDKIKKRFDLDLADPFSRNKLFDDYRYYFLTDGFSKAIPYEELLDTDTKSERSLT